MTSYLSLTLMNVVGGGGVPQDWIQTPQVGIDLATLLSTTLPSC